MWSVSVDNGGNWDERKGINLPNVCCEAAGYHGKRPGGHSSFGIEQGIDFIAASFVRRRQRGAWRSRSFCEAHNAEHIDVIAKVENAEGIKNIDEIIRACGRRHGCQGRHGRGDLRSRGSVLSEDDYPEVQRPVQAGDRGHCRCWISMIRNPQADQGGGDGRGATPSHEGTGAIMLSGETAAGRHPIEALQTMVKIAEYIGVQAVVRGAGVQQVPGG